MRKQPSASLQSIKARQKETWESGDFGRVAIYNEPSAAEFMSRLPLRPGARVLDVACGTGNLAVIAAQRGCVVSGVDIASNLIEQAQQRATKLGLNVDFREGDAEALPYADGEFDFVVSMYGVMFTPQPELAAAELLRVTKTGGTIALANWNPEGFIGEMFAVFNTFLPQLDKIPSPLLWGNEAVVRARFPNGVANISFNRRIARLEYPFPPAETVEFFRKYYGPTQRAFASLSEHKQTELRRQLEDLQSARNVAREPSQTIVPSEYLEVIAVRS